MSSLASYNFTKKTFYIVIFPAHVQIATEVSRLLPRIHLTLLYHVILIMQQEQVFWIREVLFHIIIAQSTTISWVKFNPRGYTFTITYRVKVKWVLLQNVSVMNNDIWFVSFTSYMLNLHLQIKFGGSALTGLKKHPCITNSWLNEVKQC